MAAMAEAKRRSSSAYVQLDLSTPSAFNGDSSHEPREKYGDGSPFIPAVLSGDETVDLHEASGGSSASERAEKPSVQTMVEGAVKLVSMLNFMKVELGTPKSLRSLEQWRAAAAEYIATLIFVYVGCGSVVASGIISIELSAARLLVISVAHGLAIAFLAAATGAISGGHINPAVTIAFVVAGKETLLRAALYITAQVLGAVSGAALLQSATPIAWQGSLGSHNIANGLNGGQGFLMEVILTFVLIFVIFGVAVDRRGQD